MDNDVVNHQKLPGLNRLCCWSNINDLQITFIFYLYNPIHTYRWAFILWVGVGNVVIFLAILCPQNTFVQVCLILAQRNVGSSKNRNSLLLPPCVPPTFPLTVLGFCPRRLWYVFFYSSQPLIIQGIFLPRNHLELNIFPTVRFPFSSFVISYFACLQYFMHRFVLSRICFPWPLNSFFNISVLFCNKNQMWKLQLFCVFFFNQTPLLLHLIKTFPLKLKPEDECNSWERWWFWKILSQRWT